MAIAQSVEHLVVVQGVAGSSPVSHPEVIRVVHVGGADFACPLIHTPSGPIPFGPIPSDPGPLPNSSPGSPIHTDRQYTPRIILGLRPHEPSWPDQPQ